MDDGIDGYLGRCLKNWAVQQRPPAGGLERLIRKVTARAGLESRPSAWPFYYKLPALHPFYLVPQGWSSEPFTHSRQWAFHIVDTLLQVA